ncbi:MULTISPECIES: DNA-3-methyladenine glycosylase [unclassified Francisella]|uniref:DNA-3-methyladenine glycosylase n=1 Tax=unclassified Francisella TaxID=2610885 RepID=UPI002E33E5B2|nr:MULTISPECIES: DNA-3-methyladenine glycosylase [unclassified Francisella]MED7819006.1 DNA-3-methyladenine glycosylase [Francisella sp. 19S2-4]MED7829837.1 DNA-3-methyladenine glycosylase [Francisella sp. 19S2-10]
MNDLQKLLELDTINTAKKLLGHFLVRKQNDTYIIGKIVETEAYLNNDLASHSYPKKTQRNAMMFEKPGVSYVYFTYGMHYCMNVVTSEVGIGEAVLIRALEPIQGIDQMQINRSKTKLKDLCSGPAKLTQALNINLKDNGLNLLDTNNDLYLEYNNDLNNFDIVETQRIGISKAKEKLLRFYIKDNNFISKK